MYEYKIVHTVSPFSTYISISTVVLPKSNTKLITTDTTDSTVMIDD
jgi:hypothetical protein